MGLKWRLGASNESENVQKSAQNGSKMAQKWPRRGPLGPKAGPFGAIMGVFRSFGLLDVILDQYAAAGTTHAHKCAF